MEWSDFFKWLALGAIGYIAYDISASIKALGASVGALNEKMAGVIPLVAEYGRRIERLEDGRR